MTKEDVWNLFKETGDINYYLTYVKIKEGKLDLLGTKESRRDSNK